MRSENRADIWPGRRPVRSEITMKLLLKVVTACVACALLVVLIGSVWFLWYTGDLRELDSLSQFAPAASHGVSDKCIPAGTVAVPYSEIGRPLRDALITVSGQKTMPLQIARGSMCDSQLKRLQRGLKELRIANAIRRRFTPEQVLTIYANRASFGEGRFGVEGASEHLWGKHVTQLTVAESALIAGLIRSPAYYSPQLHPDMAKQRRNQVLDRMAETGAITAKEAEQAKLAALAKQ